MRLAVLFTGALRTIKKTMRYFKQNVLLSPDVSVFACIQNDTSQPNSEWETWLSEQMGSTLKNIHWFTLDKHPEWVKHRDSLISSIVIPDQWKNYLRTSGSMIEYAQLQYAYMAMNLYEQTQGFRFDYIIKSRTDTIYAKPIDFHWLNWTDDEVNNRLEKVKEELSLCHIEQTSENILKYFMTTLTSDDFISNIQNIIATYNPCRNPTTPSTLNGRSVNEFIKRGSYILTIRANNLYIIRRDLFYLIPSLGTIYGLLHYPGEDDYWYNAENQFRAACYHSNLDIFDYCTTFEDKSLYEYDERRYFDLDYNLINPVMLYCLVRY